MFGPLECYTFNSFILIKGVHQTSEAPVVQKLDNAVHWINLYTVDTTYPLDSALQRLNNRGLDVTILVHVFLFSVYGQ